MHFSSTPRKFIKSDHMFIHKVSLKNFKVQSILIYHSHVLYISADTELLNTEPLPLWETGLGRFMPTSGYNVLSTD